MLDIYISEQFLNPVIFFLFPFLEPAITLHIDVIKLVHTIAVYGAYTYMYRYMYTVKNMVNQKTSKARLK